MQAGISKAGSIRPGAVMALLLSLVVLGVLLATAQTPPTPPGNLPLPAPPPGGANAPESVLTPDSPTVELHDHWGRLFPPPGDTGACEIQLWVWVLDSVSTTPLTKYSYVFADASTSEGAGCQGQQFCWMTPPTSPVAARQESDPQNPMLIRTYCAYAFELNSNNCHNGDWSFSVNANWTGTITRPEGDLTGSGTLACTAEYAIQNMYIASAYSVVLDDEEGEVQSPSFLVSQGLNDTPSVVVQPAAELLLGGSYDDVHYVVRLYPIARSDDTPCQSTPLPPPVHSLATPGPVTLTLSNVPRAVYAFDVEATRMTAQGETVHWCEGMPAVTPGPVEITEIHAGSVECIATADVVYNVGVVGGTSSRICWFGPTPDSPNIVQRDMAFDEVVGLGYNEQPGTDLRVGVADKHYLGVAIFDNHPERYRSHTARWALARGWTAELPVLSALTFEHDDWRDNSSEQLNPDWKTALGCLGDTSAPSYWLLKPAWLQVPPTQFFTDADTGMIGKVGVIQTLLASQAWMYNGHGGPSISIANPDYEIANQLASSELPAQLPHLRLALVMACHTASFAAALAAKSDQPCFAVGTAENIYGTVDGSQLWPFLNRFIRELENRYRYGNVNEQKLGDVYRVTIRRSRPSDQRAFVASGNPDARLDSVSGSGPVFSNGLINYGGG